MEISAFADRLWKSLAQDPPARGAPKVYEAPEGTSLAELVAEVGRLAGRPRDIARDGFTDPSLTGRTGLPLTEAFGDELLELRGWARRAHWFGCGLVARPPGARVVLVVARREDPAAAGVPADASWAGKLRAVTGWEPMGPPTVDWDAVEAELGTALPGDYKEIADLFGEGSFDEYVDLIVPGDPHLGLVGWVRSYARHPDLWQPYSVHPAPGGLLPWGASEQEIDFVWRTGAEDPDDWPVYVHSYDEWQRFDCGTGEFLVRMLTDETFGFPTSRLAGHYFTPYEL
ncbi:hypothetical protein [Streptomyces yaizuensis]|uniref:SMI1/KNR4 family protein n=1 Tax=Streptomyces yaizuensis TaxID=2989713 RepID=A0ABQ5P4H0_9ACTN|nr:hypothetical protein [Streptomyces sp. YSPA8]GLF97161.1 SMI1/KNR4 family protein [Streptomyces sp. YSPA8]